MRFLILMGLIMSNVAFAEVGKVLKVVEKGAYLTRGSQKVVLTPGLHLELEDVISSGSSYVVFQLYPVNQLSMAKNSELKISEHSIQRADKIEKTWSVIDFKKGIVRSKVYRDTNQEVELQVRTEDASFSVRGAEFEVSIEENKDIDLDVFEGEVAASSPHIQSFVPEIVKADEGFRFERKKKVWSKRRFSPKFRNHPGFEDPKKLLKQWKQKNKMKKTPANKKKK